MQEINDLNVFNNTITSQAGVVVEWYAPWCGHCQRLGPIVEGLSSNYPTLTFIKVNTDNATEICNNYGIQNMPAFDLFFQGKIIYHQRGDNTANLELLLKDLTAKVASR